MGGAGHLCLEQRGQCQAADRAWGSGVQLVFKVTYGRPGGISGMTQQADKESPGAGGTSSVSTVAPAAEMEVSCGA